MKIEKKQIEEITPHIPYIMMISTTWERDIFFYDWGRVTTKWIEES